MTITGTRLRVLASKVRVARRASGHSFYRRPHRLISAVSLSVMASLALTATAGATPVAQGPLHLACPSDALCVAAAQNGAIFSNDAPGSSGASWTATRVGSSDLTAVTCPTDAFCAAAGAEGMIFTTLSPQDSSPAWTSHRIDDSTVTTLACPTTTLCVAGTSDGALWVSRTPTSDKTWQQVFSDPSQEYECYHYAQHGAGCQPFIVAVTCPTGSLCVATDDAGSLYESASPGTAGSWTPLVSGETPPSSAYDAIACSARTECVATTPDGTTTAFDPTRRAPQLQTAAIAHNALGGLSCTASNDCFAFDDAGNLYSSSTPSEQSSWTLARSANTALTAVDCAASSTCYAVDSNGDFGPVTETGGGSGPVGTAARARLEWFKHAIPTRASRSVHATVALWALTHRHLRHVRIPRLTAPFIASLAHASLPRAAGGRAPAPRFTAADPRLRRFMTTASYKTHVARMHAAVSISGIDLGTADAPSKCGGSWYADSSSDERCSNWTYGFASYYSNGLTDYTNLLQSMPVSDVRFFVPYNAVFYYDTATSSCQFSPALTSSAGRQIAGQEYWTLFNELQDAQADGLLPIIVFDKGTTSALPPAGTQTGNSTGGGTLPAVPRPEYATDAEDYQCGVEGIIGALANNNLAPTRYEAWNEPDSDCEYLTYGGGGCDPNANGAACTTGTPGTGGSGADHAADLFAMAIAADITENRSDQIAAGTFTHPSTAYFNDYQCWLGHEGYYPTRYSYHDYVDVSSYSAVGADPAGVNFDKDLYQTFAQAGKTQPLVWITEAAADLTSSSPTYSNGNSVTCDNGQASDANKLGCVVNYNPANQQTDAGNFLNLPADTSYTSKQVVKALWYQLQPANGSTGSDSGMLDPPSPTVGYSQLAPNGLYGSNTSASGRRLSFCVLSRQTSANCSSDTIGAGDWSVRPTSFTATLSPNSTTVTNVSSPGYAQAVSSGAWVTCWNEATGTSCPYIPSGTQILSSTYNSATNTGTWTLSRPVSVPSQGVYVVTVTDTQDNQ